MKDKKIVCPVCKKEYPGDSIIIGAEYVCPYCGIRIKIVSRPIEKEINNATK